MVRVGIDENIADELLIELPPEVEIVRVPRNLATELAVDFWILIFARKDAAETISRLRGVKVIQSMMAGVDWILPWLPSGVTLCDGRGIHDISTSEWVVAAILASVKRIPLYRDLQTQHDWRGQATASRKGLVNDGDARVGQYRVLGEDVAGRTVLIIGYGSIGAAIEARLTPFGVNFIRAARSAKQTPEVFPVSELGSLLPKADIVVAIVPLTAETKGLIGAREIGLMKKGALLVNAARGPVVDTDALVQALQENRIHAVLDVTDPEPLPPDHLLWSAPNCLITPHVAGSTPEFTRRAFRFGAAQIRRFMADEPLENVVSDAGY